MNLKRREQCIRIREFMDANNLKRISWRELAALGLPHSSASVSRYIKSLAELGLVDASSRSYIAGQTSRPILPAKMVKKSENIRGDVELVDGWYKCYKEGFGLSSKSESTDKIIGDTQIIGITKFKPTEDDIFALFVEENVILKKEVTNSDIMTRILQCRKSYPCSFTSNDIINTLNISRQAYFYAIKKLISDGSVSEIGDKKKSKEYQWNTTHTQKEDFKLLYKKARFLTPANTKKNVKNSEDIRGDVGGAGGFILSSDITKTNTSFFTDNQRNWDMAKLLSQEYNDCWGEKRFVKGIDIDFLRAYCRHLSRPIYEPYYSMLQVVNKLYNMELEDRLTKEELNEIKLHFNQNYRGDISETKKSFTITRSTRMHHKWAYRNKDKVFIPVGYTADEIMFDKSKSVIYMQDFMTRVFKSDYQQFDISSTVPRIVAGLNGIDIPFEGKDCYRLIVEQTLCPDSKWQNVLYNYDGNRQVIKKLFMLCYFVNNSSSVSMYCIPSLITDNDEEIARIYDEEKDENVRKDRTKLETLNITPEMYDVLYDEESIDDFWQATKKVLGGKVYSGGEVFFIESVIELLTLHHFLTAGHLIVNNFDEFFFGADVSMQAVKQEVFKNLTDVCTMYRGGEQPLPKYESVKKLVKKALIGSSFSDKKNGQQPC